jgi:hypothetical protein
MLQMIALPQLGEAGSEALAKLAQMTDPAALEAVALRVPEVESWCERLGQ